MYCTVTVKINAYAFDLAFKRHPPVIWTLPVKAPPSHLENWALVLTWLYYFCNFFIFGSITAARDVDELLSTAVYVRDRINPYLFYYGLSVALLHRPDTQNLDLPSFVHVFPDKYIDSQVFARAREEAVIVPEGSRVSIRVLPNFY